MVKAYLRYELAGTFGVVNSDANVVCDGNYIVSAALENVVIWNAKLGTQVGDRFEGGEPGSHSSLIAPQHKVLQAPQSVASSQDGAPRVTALALDAHSKRIAAGHSNGTVCFGLVVQSLLHTTTNRSACGTWNRATCCPRCAGTRYAHTVCAGSKLHQFSTDMHQNQINQHRAW